jgi:hypothetical protein
MVIDLKRVYLRSAGLITNPLSEFDIFNRTLVWYILDAIDEQSGMSSDMYARVSLIDLGGVSEFIRHANELGWDLTPWRETVPPYIHSRAWGIDIKDDNPNLVEFKLRTNVCA